MKSIPPDRIVIFILGPTGVGKTELSLEIARRIPSEIISADSRQIYKYMDIGTAKPSKDELLSVPHHFIDLLDPDQFYSAGQFGHDARNIIEKIFEKGKLPLVVGGSGLYVKALIEGFFKGDVRDMEMRKTLQQRLKEEGSQSLYDQLEKIDEASANKIHPNNAKRIIRALEIFYSSGIKASELYKNKIPPAEFTSLKFGINKERKKLYADIENRVDMMFKNGLLNEVSELLNKGYHHNLNSMNSVGYKETIQYLKDEIDMVTWEKKVKQNSRNYAKRQLTWFRAVKEIKWFMIETQTDIIKIADQILALYDLSKKGPT